MYHERKLQSTAKLRHAADRKYGNGKCNEFSMIAVCINENT